MKPLNSTLGRTTYPHMDFASKLFVICSVSFDTDRG